MFKNLWNHILNPLLFQILMQVMPQIVSAALMELISEFLRISWSRITGQVAVAPLDTLCEYPLNIY